MAHLKGFSLALILCCSSPSIANTSINDLPAAAAPQLAGELTTEHSVPALEAMLLVLLTAGFIRRSSKRTPKPRLVVEFIESNQRSVNHAESPDLAQQACFYRA